MTLKQTVWLHKTLPTAGWPCYTCACIALQDSPERAARPPSRPPPWLSVGGQEAPGAVRGMAHTLRTFLRAHPESRDPRPMLLPVAKMDLHSGPAGRQQRGWPGQ